MDNDTAVVTCPSCGKRNRVPRATSGMPRCGSCAASLPWTVNASDGDFAAVAEAATLPVLVDLWAPWCGPCRSVSPLLERIAEDRAGQLKLVKVNVDESPVLAERFDVRGIPTLLLLRRGEVIARQTGAPPEPALRAWIDQPLCQQ